MRQVKISLSKENAELLLPLISSMSSNIKGKEKKIITDLTSALSKQLEVIHKAEEIDLENEKVDQAIIHFRDKALDMFAFMKGRGLSNQVVSYISAVDGIFSAAKTKFKDEYESFIANLPESERGDAALSLQQVDALLDPFVKQIDTANKRFLASKNTVIQASPDYTLVPRRQMLSKRCFNSALREGRQAKDWVDLDMISLSFSDMRHHLDLGVALLEGDPDQIKQASYMDTACRDGLDDAVWNFVLDVVNGDSKGYKKSASTSSAMGKTP